MLFAALKTNIWTAIWSKCRNYIVTSINQLIAKSTDYLIKKIIVTCSSKYMTSLCLGKMFAQSCREQQCRHTYYSCVNWKKGWKNESWQANLCSLVCPWGSRGTRIKTQATKLSWFYLLLVLPTLGLLVLFTRTKSSLSLALLSLASLIHFGEGIGAIHQGHCKCSSDDRLFLSSPIPVLLIWFPSVGSCSLALSVPP